MKLISIDTVVINLGRIVDRALTPFQEKLENLDLFILAYPKLFTYLKTGFANNHNVKVDNLTCNDKQKNNKIKIRLIMEIPS